jgi:hypothetical protein
MAGFTGDDLIEEALRYAGAEQSTGDDVFSARRSMYLLMEEWSARWGQTFRVGRAFIDLLPATPGIPLEAFAGVDEVIDVVVSAKPGAAVPGDTFVPVTSRLSASEYAKITDKMTDGQPSSYYLERTEPPTLYCYPTGAGRAATVWFHYKPSEFDHDSNNLDVPRRWYRALMLATALGVAAKRPWPTDAAMMNSQQQRIASIETWAAAALAEARPSDRERTPYRVRLA